MKKPAIIQPTTMAKNKKEDKMEDTERMTSIEADIATSICLHIVPFRKLLTKIFSHSHQIALYSFEQKIITKKLIEMTKIFDLETSSEETQNILDKEGNVDTKVLDKKIADQINEKTKIISIKLNKFTLSTSRTSRSSNTNKNNNNKTQLNEKGANNSAYTKKKEKKVKFSSALKKNPRYSRDDNTNASTKESKKKNRNTKSGNTKKSSNTNSSRNRK